ncbi:AsmA-like C-terminal region-containing protein [Phaeovulum vinaykumarii]|uniref:AsmA-like C-terminal region-containing protein n=1 Tax=Phaeovulum vinaykumarii TaxID=407234 RepID=UPI00117B4FDA|nr:AsmA-like C-terminal region-containing protein [Phaeovulum vinaykumarii]
MPSADVPPALSSSGAPPTPEAAPVPDGVPDGAPPRDAPLLLDHPLPPDALPPDGPPSDGPPGAPRPRTRARGRGRTARFGFWLILSLPIFLAATLLSFLALTRMPVAVPDLALATLETRVNAALGGAVRIRVAGGADIAVERGLVPQLRLRGVEIDRPSGLPIAVLPELRGSVWPGALLAGEVRLRRLRISGAGVALRRNADGALDLRLGGALALSGARPESAAEAVAAFRNLFALPVLSGLESLKAEGLELRMDDARLGRQWRVSDGRLSLTQDDRAIALRLGFDVGERDRLPSSVAMMLETRKDSAETRLTSTVTAVSAPDLALFSPALSWGRLIEAPITGSIRSGIDAAGNLARFDARLEIGAGRLAPPGQARPIAFAGGLVDLSYDPASARMTLNELSLDSRALRLRAAGQALLRDGAGPARPGVLPTGFLGQIDVRDLQVDPEGLFEHPVAFSRGAADIRVGFDPFTVELGQSQLVADGHRLSSRGTIAAAPEGWRIALDFGADRIARDRLIRLWPVNVVARTREWLDQNVATGELSDVTAALRLRPDAAPRLALGYSFAGAEVRFLRSLPPAQDGVGYATIEGFQHALVVEAGHVIAPSGGRIDVTGTQMIVPDIRIKPAPAVVRLRTRSDIPAALSLLDEPPFRFLTKAGMPTDLARGQAQVAGDLRLTLARKLDTDAVDYDLTAQLRQVVSDQAVPGRRLEAEALDLAATRAGVRISGRARLDGVGFEGSWRQAFGPENRGRSQVEGRVEVSPQTLARFGIGLPKGMLSGAGTGRIALDLVKDQPTRYRFSSDLAGIGLSIPQIGWSLGAARTGKLELAGQLGARPTVESLSLEAPGLTADGSVTLGEGGALEQARFERLRIGGWFDGGATLEGRGAGRAPRLRIEGGRLVLARMPAGGTGGGGTGGGSDDAPIEVALDRVEVSDQVALTGFSGRFARGGRAGSFGAWVNGKAPIRGTMMPATGGRARIAIEAADAGAVLSSAKVFGRAEGGRMVLRLDPAGAEAWDGTLDISGLRVTRAPRLAAMLSAASVVGLLEQLNGEGLLFNKVDGRFRLDRTGLRILEGVAEGASMGVTMTGTHDFASNRLDMEGVVSPLYLINGIGQIISRRGEGIFGFTYELSGSADAPRVTVNPLSIFTPGFFREIFRRQNRP